MKKPKLSSSYFVKKTSTLSKIPCSCTRKKKPNSVENTLVLCQFFLIFQIIAALMPIFYQRNVQSQKYKAPILLFSAFSWKNHFSYAYILSKKRPAAKNNLLLSYAFFFLIFTTKLLLSCPYPVKKRTFSKKQTAHMPIFCQKNVYCVKNTVLISFFFQIFHEKPLLSCPHLVK